MSSGIAFYENNSALRISPNAFSCSIVASGYYGGGTISIPIPGEFANSKLGVIYTSVGIAGSTTPLNRPEFSFSNGVATLRYGNPCFYVVVWL